MSALDIERLTEFAGVVPSRGTYGIKANKRIFKGALVGIDSAGRAMPGDTIANGCLSGVGKASATYDNRTGSVLGGGADACDVEVEYGVFEFDSATGGGDDIAADDVGKVCFVVDDHTVALTNGTDTRGIAGLITEVRDGKVFVWMGPHVAALIVIAASEASQLDTAQTDIDALQTDVANLQTDAGVGSVCFKLTDLRETTSGGDVANAAGNGGLLASDTTPILRGDSTNSQEVSWAAGNADVVMLTTTLPPDVDGGQNVTLDLWVYTDNSGGGGIDAATFTVQTNWDGGAAVSDTATDGSPATSIHKITATIAASDVPATPSLLTILLTPAAHAADPVQLVGARLNYTRVQT